MISNFKGIETKEIVLTEKPKKPQELMISYIIIESRALYRLHDIFLNVIFFIKKIFNLIFFILKFLYMFYRFFFW